jgi:hypothetical protein
MILYTIQPEIKWLELQDTGILKSHDSIICEPSFNDSYAWIESKMRELLPAPEIECKHPVWAWFKYNNKSKPSLKNQLPKDEIGYLIKFHIDDNKVLLSSFDKWHLVLNHSEQDLKAKKTIFDFDEYENQDDLSMLEAEGFVQEGDKMVFDWDKVILDKNSFESTIQATFWYLKKDQIISYKKYKSR